MKTENNLENKAKFFAIYYGQEVISDLRNDGLRVLYAVVLSNMYRFEENWVYLQLKPLESISDEDAKYLGYADNISATTTYLKSLGKELKEADYLRSKSYALPWMDLSVQDLIDYGWIKLKG